MKSKMIDRIMKEIDEKTEAFEWCPYPRISVSMEEEVNRRRRDLFKAILERHLPDEATVERIMSRDRNKIPGKVRSSDDTYESSDPDHAGEKPKTETPKKRKLTKYEIDKSVDYIFSVGATDRKKLWKIIETLQKNNVFTETKKVFSEMISIAHNRLEEIEIEEDA